MRKPDFNSDFLLGIGGLVAGCLILIVWIPLDVETGLIEKVRSRVVIGDSLAPSLSALVLIVAGLMQTIQSFRTRGTGSAELSWNSVKYVGLMLALLGLSMAAMRWTGPIAAHVGHADYRSLRDTVPWKYIGYLLGGSTMVFGLISMIEGRLRWRVLIISVLAVLALMLVYDLPFDNLLLPPNGDL
jgi:hypothetical protein